MGDRDSLDAVDQDSDEDRPYRRIELITGRHRRRRWTAEEKAEIVAESMAIGANISEVARRHGVNRGLLAVWRRHAQAEAPAAGAVECAPERATFVPVEVAAEPSPGADDRFRDAGGTRDAGAGRIEFDLRSGRLVFSGVVDPDLAAAIVGAARGRR